MMHLLKLIHKLALASLTTVSIAGIGIEGIQGGTANASTIFRGTNTLGRNVNDINITFINPSPGISTATFEADFPNTLDEGIRFFETPFQIKNFGSEPFVDFFGAWTFDDIEVGSVLDFVQIDADEVPPNETVFQLSVQSIEQVPEPSLSLGILAFYILGTTSMIKYKLKSTKFSDSELENIS